MNGIQRIQGGFSILSLMIASAIGIFLLGGAGKVYVDSKNTFNARSAVAAATENYRFAFQDLRRTLVMAGRSISPADDDDNAYSANDNGLRTFPAVSGTDDGLGITDIDGNGSSIIAVRYAAGPAPCGLAGPWDGTLTARFLVSDQGDLVCHVPERDHRQPLVSGIARMRALYGVDTGGDGVANQYLSAKAVDTAIGWVNVVAIRIGLVVGSGDGQELPGVYRPSTEETLDLLGSGYQVPDTIHAYKSVSTTIALRNLHQTMNRQVAN
ncbi:MAG: PilW family protein [Candidatus Thiodiazotropha sp. (ex Epidulcina cf. delphinae)]|nr:PilW family protein [Candidatus Thiodiazotropha sp. (ex Epidulcina cf. delphinae)]